jgi:hypothetical protein
LCASSEKVPVEQVNLFNEAKEESDEPESDTCNITVPAHTRKQKKRILIPAELPREEIIHDLPESLPRVAFWARRILQRSHCQVRVHERVSTPVSHQDHEPGIRGLAKRLLRLAQMRTLSTRPGE